MMNENRIMRKGAVREMNRYWLHAASGELSLARDNGKNIEKESEPDNTIKYGRISAIRRKLSASKESD